MTETLQAYNYDPLYILWMLFAGWFCVIAFEVAVWAIDEDAYSPRTRKGDVTLGIMLTTIWVVLIAPHFWLMMDGVQLPIWPHVTFTVHYYNEATAAVFGLFYEFIWKGAKAIIKKYAKQSKASSNDH